MIELTGEIERSSLGTGAWLLVETGTGRRYELYRPPTELRSPGLQVRLVGRLRPEVVTAAAIGPVVQVETFVLTPPLT